MEIALSIPRVLLATRCYLPPGVDIPRRHAQLFSYGNSRAGGFSDKLVVLVGHYYLGDTNPLATLYYPTLRGEFIIYPGTSDEVDVELGGYTGMG